MFVSVSTTSKIIKSKYKAQDFKALLKEKPLTVSAMKKMTAGELRKAYDRTLKIRDTLDEGVLNRAGKLVPGLREKLSSKLSTISDTMYEITAGLPKRDAKALLEGSAKGLMADRKLIMQDVKLLDKHLVKLNLALRQLSSISDVKLTRGS